MQTPASRTSNKSSTCRNALSEGPDQSRVVPLREAVSSFISASHFASNMLAMSAAQSQRRCEGPSCDIDMTNTITPRQMTTLPSAVSTPSGSQYRPHVWHQTREICPPHHLTQSSPMSPMHNATSTPSPPSSSAHQHNVPHVPGTAALQRTKNHRVVLSNLGMISIAHVLPTTLLLKRRQVCIGQQWVPLQHGNKRNAKK